MGKEHKFGGIWTAEKLNIVTGYLSTYTTIFTKNKNARYYKTNYVDAFAGTGRIELNIDSAPLLQEKDPAVQKLIDGSAVSALEITPPFDNYIFIDSSKSHCKSLTNLKSIYPSLASRIHIKNGDANCKLQEWVKQQDWRKNRAVVFLDPYGLQVDWATIDCLAKTQAIDLWLLFPIGMAVSRLLTKNNKPPQEWAKALDRTFGTTEWQQEFYKPTGQGDLFNDETEERRTANINHIGTYMLNRLSTIFAKVSSNPKPLNNKNGNPLFWLIFAASNPKKAEIGVRIANSLLQ